eukprot:m.1082922 g.1082922  ORF g.1082922 m.1082922 type:complete len:234 (+) comp24267_c0_seq39:93-794(+)
MASAQDRPSRPAWASSKGKCPVGYGSKQGSEDNARTEEPPDTPDRPLPQAATGHSAPVNQEAGVDVIPGEIAPTSSIPATGRGNSEDGQHWLNPSPYQLHRALKRKGKPIEKEDSFSVSNMHELVVVQSWECIMEYEQLWSRTCKEPKLARFEGRDGDYSFKAQMLQRLGVPLPYDRHDWTVDRCGKEVRYIIDYYSSGDDYWIDARPAPTLLGMFDRARLALLKMSRGHSPW